MGNPITSHLPPDIDVFLGDLSQLTSMFSYMDMTKFKPTSGQLSQIRKLWLELANLRRGQKEDAGSDWETQEEDIYHRATAIAKQIKEMMDGARSEPDRRMGPLAATHSLVGKECPACHLPLKAGDYMGMIVLGPGNDPEERCRCQEGRPYNAVAVVVHWDCADPDRVD